MVVAVGAYGRLCARAASAANVEGEKSTRGFRGFRLESEGRANEPGETESVVQQGRDNGPGILAMAGGAILYAGYKGRGTMTFDKPDGLTPPSSTRQMTLHWEFSQTTVTFVPSPHTDRV